MIIYGRNTNTKNRKVLKRKTARLSCNYRKLREPLISCFAQNVARPTFYSLETRFDLNSRQRKEGHLYKMETDILEKEAITGYPNYSNATSDCSVNGINGSCLLAEKPETRYILAWWIQMIYIIGFGTLVIVAAVGNIIVIWIVLAHRRMRTVTNYFLLNLAISDTMISLTNTLFNFAYMLYNNWPFGLLYCRISNFISTVTICVSTFTLMAISIDR